MSLRKKALMMAGLAVGVVGVCQWSSFARAEDCTNAKPFGTPDLFQINRNGDSATLYWAPVKDNNDSYMIRYGENGMEHSVMVNSSNPDGVNSFTISHLEPSVNYKFSIRGNNGCMPGEWGNTMKTGSATSTGAAPAAKPAAPAPEAPKPVAETPAPAVKEVKKVEAHDDYTLGVTNTATKQTVYYRYY